jgi:putative transposase
MPTRPRIDLAGYHHIINRGVNRCDVFNTPTDKEMFLKIFNKMAYIHHVTLHDYCLMDNHYHLLIETQKENLATCMRIVNANYAQYFNKRYQRSGHLWQDRYKSKYITSEVYLYTLIRYIENNPVEAGICGRVGEYPFTLAGSLLNAKAYHPCSKASILIKEFDMQTLAELLDVPMSEEEMNVLKKMQKEKIEKTDEGFRIRCSMVFEEHFYDIQSNQERNTAIVNAYLDGHTQADIARYLNLSKSLISKVIKSGDSTPWV